MSKFNVRDNRASARGPIVTEATPTGRTHEGAPGYARDEKSELFLLAVANMAGEPTFYESADARDARYVALVRQVAVADPAWTADMLRWLRAEGNMRSASLIGALEAAKAMVAADIPGSRQIVASVLQRADEPGEALAYWTNKYGRGHVPKPVKRGIADAVLRLYTEYSLLKYDTASKGYRFGDVIDLVHPTATTPAQGDLFKHALDRRHGRAEELDATLPMVLANARLRARVHVGQSERLLNPDTLKAAGMTWEDALSLAGNKLTKGMLWEALIPTMGYMALLRNLRNFDQAGISERMAATVAARLADPAEVAHSRQFPFRFLAAYRNVPSLRWGHALDVALSASLANVPELPGRTLVLVDRSGSMFNRMSAKSELDRADTAAVFGSALALRNVGRADLVEFGSSSKPIPVRAGDSLLKTVDRFGDLGGTNTWAAVRSHYAEHDRVVIVTDEQAYDGDPGAAIPANVPLYTWNLAGYRHGHGPGASNRHTFGGLTDTSFRVVPLIERHRDGGWPWQ